MGRKKKPKVENPSDLKREELRNWLYPLLEERLGQRSLNEYLWMTSFWWHSCPLDSGILTEKEFRRLLISVNHAWISENRSKIISSWDQTLYSADVSERRKLEERPYERIRRLRGWDR